MSRIGKQAIVIPENVDIVMKESCPRTVCVKGPRGELTFTLPPFLKIEIEHIRKGQTSSVCEFERVIYLKIKERPTFKVYKELYGLSRTALYNTIKGVTEGFQKRLRLTGVGYRAAVEDGCLVLNVGYSQVVKVVIPDSIYLQCETATSVCVSGIRKDQVGNFASKVRLIRAPEPYKGKGISYEDELVHRKPGKTGK